MLGFNNNLSCYLGFILSIFTFIVVYSSIDPYIEAHLVTYTIL